MSYTKHNRKKSVTSFINSLIKNLAEENVFDIYSMGCTFTHDWGYPESSLCDTITFKYIYTDCGFTIKIPWTEIDNNYNDILDKYTVFDGLTYDHITHTSKAISKSLLETFEKQLDNKKSKETVDKSVLEMSYEAERQLDIEREREEMKRQQYYHLVEMCKREGNVKDAIIRLGDDVFFVDNEKHEAFKCAETSEESLLEIFRK